MGSEARRLHSHHHTSFCKRFVRKNRPLPHPHKPARHCRPLGICPFRTWQARQAGLEHGIWQLCGKTSIFYEDFGSSILSLSLTLNPAFSGKPCRRSRLKRSGSGEPVNAYDVKYNKTNTTCSFGLYGLFLCGKSKYWCPRKKSFSHGFRNYELFK